MASYRVLLALGVLAAPACGRLGFDEHANASGAADADADTDARDAARCLATPVAGLDLTQQAPVRGLAATGTGAGFALAFLRGDRTAIDGIALDAALVPEVSAPRRTTPVDGVDAEYIAAVLHWDGTRIVGALTGATGELQIKTLPDDMTLFTANVQVPGTFPADPVILQAGATRFAIARDGTGVIGHELDATGLPTGTNVRFDRGAPRAVTVGSSELRGFALADLGEAGCELYPFPADPFGAPITVPGSCRSAYLAQQGTALRVVARAENAVIVRRGLTAPDVTLEPAVAIPGAALVESEQLAGPRAAYAGGRARYVWFGPSGFAIASDADDASFAHAVPDSLPAGAPDAWHVAVQGDVARVFAAYGSALWSFPLCD